MIRCGRNARRRAALAACLTVAMTAPAPAQTEAGNALLDACLVENSAEMARCVAYVSAIADTMRNGNAMYGWYACPPPAVPPLQAYDVVMTFMRWRGDLRHYSASALVAHALAGAFPCLRR